MAAGESGEQTGAAGRVNALEACEAEAAAGSAELPSSSSGGAPYQQHVVVTAPKRIALPEHAKMVAELQVCLPVLLYMGVRLSCTVHRHSHTGAPALPALPESESDNCLTGRYC